MSTTNSRQRAMSIDENQCSTCDYTHQICQPWSLNCAMTRLAATDLRRLLVNDSSKPIGLNNATHSPFHNRLTLEWPSSRRAMETCKRTLTSLIFLAASVAFFGPAPLGAQLVHVPSVIWHNSATGEVQEWQLDAAGGLSKKQDLDWRCDAASGCSHDWRIVGAGNFNSDNALYINLLWHNATTGVVGAWLRDPSSDDQFHVTGSQDVDWRCDAASGCSSHWRAVGTGDFNRDGRTDLLWHNPTTGEVSAWLLDSRGMVIGTQPLSWKCDVFCAVQWYVAAIGDFNKDGNTDVLWHNATTGVVGAWLLDSHGTVIGTQDLNWTCDKASGCASQWRIVGAGDFNVDENTDVLWYNATTGVLGAWLLNSSGTVLKALDLSERCGTATGCSTDWKPVAITDRPHSTIK